MKEQQQRTPQDQVTSRRSKKPQKIAKRSLAPEFSSISSDAGLEISKESLDFLQDSEILSVDSLGEITQSSVPGVNPTFSASSDDKNELGILNFSSSNKSEGSEFGCVEAEIAVTFLKEALSHGRKSKKILDALIEIIIDDSSNSPEERDRFAELVSAKNRIVLVCFLLWILALAGVFFFKSASGSSLNGPLPT